MANFYIELAKKILEIAKQPLSAREMITLAQSAKLIPEKYAKAKTPHKTIQARLAESIRKNGAKSPFYRFARGKFGLRSNLLDLDYHRRFAQEFKAPIRRKEISNETVLCIRRSKLEIDDQNGFFELHSYHEFIERRDDLEYCLRKIAERDTSLKQIVTYVAVIKGKQILCYERGAYSATGKELIGRRSIGFGGHVSADDVDLFSLDRHGILSNAWRELSEELNLTDKQMLTKGPQIVGLINDNSTQEGQKHIAIAMIVCCDPRHDLTKGELEIKNLHWKSVAVPPNDIEHFEIWSRIFLEYLVRNLDAIIHAHR
jgi:predicted NUDIX family phosphoesterase